jgi:phosphatidate cytidylyltransferase
MVFSIAILLAVALGAWEWADVIGIVGVVSRLAYIFVLLCTIFGVAVWLGFPAGVASERAHGILLIAVTLWAVIFLWIQGYPSSAILWSPKPIQAITGILLLTFTWVAIVSILNKDQGQWLLLVGILIVVLADVGGFVVGKIAGRHKMAPVVSPGKTWEGFAGGLVFQLILIVCLMQFWSEPLSMVNLSVLVFPVALYSVIGDLFESMVKRRSGVKDSGAILPGHGGVLDRIDGIMAALPMYALLLYSNYSL